jgi:pimeloyl-ACP methyl ester carboxylesterase
MSNTHHVLGSGRRKVILLHGWFGDGHSWAQLEPLLDASAFTWVFMDYRGYGGMKDAPGEYTMDEIAADTIALADSLGFSDFSLVGHSMGGMAIQRVLVGAPDRVESLVAITPVPASGVPFDEQGWALFSGAADKRENRCAIIDYTTGNRHPQAWVDAIVDYSLEHASRAGFAAYLHAWAKTDFSAQVKGLAHRVKVIVGAHDPALTADVARATWLAWYPNATLETLADAGHYPMVETPGALARSMQAFLQH